MYTKLSRRGAQPSGPNGERSKDHPLYATWYGMRQRCYYTAHRSFAHYGGSGIQMCDRWWDSFWNFVEDMGPKPTPKHSIDRIDPSGNYSPENCRWATSREQSDNTRHVCGENHGSAKLDELDIVYILCCKARGVLGKDIAKRTGVTYQHVGHICKGKKWAAVTRSEGE